MENERKRLDTAESARITDFTQLDVWRIARKLRIEAYAIAKLFPTEETIWPSTPIAKSRRFHYRKYCGGVRALFVSGKYSILPPQSWVSLRGPDHFITALDAGYIPREKYKEARALAISVIRLLNGYIRSTAKLKGRASRE